MKPYDKSDSFMRRVTKRVSGLLPSTTWMNTLLGESQTIDDASSSNENDDQPPFKKLCTSNNTFTNVNNRTSVESNSTDNHRSSHMNVLLPEISAVTCLPSTSRQNPKFTSQSNSSLSHDIGSKSSLKRKSDAVDFSNNSRRSEKASAFNFASSTPTEVTVNKKPMFTNCLKSLHSDKQSTANDFLTPTSTKLTKSRENESQSLLKLRETTTKYVPSPSFRWDTFVNYGELSDRQKLFAQRSPLNCSQVMYGGRSANSNLSKILGHSPLIHKKTTIPISPTKNSEIRTTSSVLLDHISTKDKVIEENKFIIQPRIHLKHKADQKSVPIKLETTVNVVDTTTPEKIEEKSNNISSICSGRDSSRKLKANITKKARGLQSDKLEMPAKVDLPDISLPVPVLPCISLSIDNSEEDEFTFNQPLTIEQFSSQIAEKSYKKQNTTLKKMPNSNCNPSLKDQNSSPSFDVFMQKPTKKETEIVITTNNNDISPRNSINVVKKSISPKFGDSSKSTFNTSIQNPGFKLESIKPTNIIFKNSQVSSGNNQQQSDKLSVEPKKWSCDTCWVSNDGDKLNCVACQTPKTSNVQKPISIIKSSTWTCETCWVPNKNEVDTCVACQTQKLGTTKKGDQCWTCDACWVKNKYENNSCISCGTVKPGSVPESKPQHSTQLNLGFNNNSFEKSGCNQIKFGFGGKIDQSNQFKFGSPVALKNSENSKSDVASTTQFKFGVVETKSDQPLSTFKFGSSDSAASQPEIKLGVDQPSNKFKFGFEKKTDQPENQIKFGLNYTTSVPISKINYGSDNVEKEKAVQQNSSTDCNKINLSTNESLNEVNNENEMSGKSVELQCSPLKFGDAKVIQKSPQFTFGSVISNHKDSITSTNNGNKNEDVAKEKFVLDVKEVKPLNFGMPQTNPSSIGTTNPVQMVNGHSLLNEDQKQGLIKTPELFSFGSLAKQDQHLSDGHKTLTFGSVTSDNKSFAASASATSNFPNVGPVFGTSNLVFGNVPASTSASFGSSALTPLFSFGGSIPPVSNSFFSPTIKNNDKPSTQNSNSFTSTTKVSFSFGTQSQPVFSAVNTVGLFTNSAIQADSQVKNVSNNLFNQSSTKPSVKLDPNAPISINFTGGATTQFTAKPETTEPPTKRKILKPVRRIR